MLVYGGVEGSVWVCSGVVGGEEGLGKGEAVWEEELISSLTQSNVELESRGAFIGERFTCSLERGKVAVRGGGGANHVSSDGCGVKGVECRFAVGLMLVYVFPQGLLVDRTGAVGVHELFQIVCVCARGDWPHKRETTATAVCTVKGVFEFVTDSVATMGGAVVFGAARLGS